MSVRKTWIYMWQRCECWEDIDTCGSAVSVKEDMDIHVAAL